MSQGNPFPAQRPQEDPVTREAHDGPWEQARGPRSKLNRSDCNGLFILSFLGSLSAPFFACRSHNLSLPCGRRCLHSKSRQDTKLPFHGTEKALGSFRLRRLEPGAAGVSLGLNSPGSETGQGVQAEPRSHGAATPQCGGTGRYAGMPHTARWQACPAWPSEAPGVLSTGNLPACLRGSHGSII